MAKHQHHPNSGGSSTGSVLTALMTCLLVYGLAGIALWRVTASHADLRDCGGDAVVSRAAAAVTRPGTPQRRDAPGGLSL